MYERVCECMSMMHGALRVCADVGGGYGRPAGDVVPGVFGYSGCGASCSVDRLLSFVREQSTMSNIVHMRVLCTTCHQHGTQQLQGPHHLAHHRQETNITSHDKHATNIRRVNSTT